MLKRSRAFHAETGQPVDVLTFDPNNDYTSIRKSLNDSGLLVKGVQIINIWEHLGTLPDRALGKPPWWKRTLPRRGTRSLSVEPDITSDVSTTEHVEHLRADGSVVATLRTTEDAESGDQRRSITIHDRRGVPIQDWSRMTDLYHWWLDILLPPTEARWLMIDSAWAAPILATYVRPHVHRFHQIHNKHLRSDQLPPYGPLTRGRRYLGDHLNSFEGIVFLTDRQRRDVDQLLGTGTNRFVIPNSRDLVPDPPHEATHQRNCGVMLTRLSHQKRIEHAILVVAQVAENTRVEPASLTIYGNGSNYSGPWRCSM